MKSIKTKIIFSVGSLLIFVCIGLGIISYISASNAITSQTNETLPQVAHQGAKVVSERIKAILNTLEAVANNDRIKDPNISWEEKKILLEEEVKRSGHLFIAYAQPDGFVQDTTGKSTNIQDRAYFQKALSGEKAMSDPIKSKTTGAMIVAYAVPIKNNGQIMGVLIAMRDGINLSNLTNDVTYGQSGKALMINKKGTVVAHSNKDLVMNMYNAMEEVKKNPKLKPLVKVQEQMIEGKKGVGEYELDGVVKLMGYAPVEGTEWSLAVAAPKDEILSGLKSLGFAILIASVLFLLASLSIGYFIASLISNPVISASENLRVIATGDFTHEIPKGFQRSKDEIGVLVKSINTMQESIKEVIKSVVKESRSVAESVLTTGQHISELTSQIKDVSDTTENLSAGMEETAAATEEMNATASDIEQAIDSIASKAQQGSIAAGEISYRAGEIKKAAKSSQKSANDVYISTQDNLRKAIEQSKAVEQINVLSNAILQITSQTNLLALNAAIEAARAGEAGKGFAVVAEEIRKLAEDSKNAVNEIQKVTKTVVSSVTNLTESSGEVLNFIDKQVLKDYDSMVEIGEQYSRDADLVDNLVTDFSATAQQLAASIQNIVKAINEITSAANEGAEGTTNIAGKAAIVVEKADAVMNQADLSKESADKLIKIVSKFRV